MRLCVTIRRTKEYPTQFAATPSVTRAEAGEFQLTMVLYHGASSPPRSGWAESDCTPCGIARIMGAAHAMEEPHS